MDEGQLAEVARKFIQLADAKGQATRDQCLLLGHLWGDNDALREIAKMTGASEALLRKGAGAGAVGLEKLWPEKQPKEWAFQVSLWPYDDWEWISDIADGAELKASDLKALRICVEKIEQAGGEVHIDWADAEPNEEEETPPMVRRAIEEPTADIQGLELPVPEWAEEMPDSEEEIEDAIPF